MARPKKQDSEKSLKPRKSRVKNKPKDVQALKIVPKKYVVSEGRAVNTKRGILTSGEEVFQKDFSNKEVFIKRIEKGLITEVSK